ncbi:hypothetical protein GCM10011405_32110 [Rufibacter glacialis]|nr:hypothetical protein GCM10011405_32110 [Rufibacter glacialis]
MPATTEFATADYQLVDLTELEAPEVSLGSEATAFTCTPRETSKEKMETLKRALQHLGLDENQKTAVKGFVQQHNACIAPSIDRIHSLHHDLLRKANAAREEYIIAYKAGKITKPQLEENLAKLRASLKAELEKHEVKQRQMRLVRKCRQELLQKIEAVLNQNQLLKWNNWKSRLS